MSNITPNQIWNGFSISETGITIPFAALPGLSGTEAEPLTGDAREVIRIFCESAYQKIKALPTEEKPNKLTMSKESPRGLSEDAIRQDYTFQFQLFVNQAGSVMLSE